MTNLDRLLKTASETGKAVIIVPYIDSVRITVADKRKAMDLTPDSVWSCDNTYGLTRDGHTKLVESGAGKMVEKLQLPGPEVKIFTDQDGRKYECREVT